MRLDEIGEFGLIERIGRLARRHGAPAPRWMVGPGDDAAVLRPPSGRELVVTTDALLEGVHFRWLSERPSTLGRRALAAALSDLAAMGAAPLGILLALEVPPSLELRRVEGLVRGLLAAGRRYACPLVGGNVTRATRTGMTLTALGAVERGRVLTRSAARPGDRLYVTGRLGGAALAVVRARREGRRIGHVTEPRLRAGRSLARLAGVGACIDVSDGLLADLEHLLHASRVEARLELEAIPRPPGLAAACRRLGVNPDRLVLEGGEDYELLFTLSSSRSGPAALRPRSWRAASACGSARSVGSWPGALARRPARGNPLEGSAGFGRRPRAARPPAACPPAQAGVTSRDSAFSRPSRSPRAGPILGG
jgi:thiamine-monophosphate kinase